MFYIDCFRTYIGQTEIQFVRSIKHLQNLYKQKAEYRIFTACFTYWILILESKRHIVMFKKGICLFSEIVRLKWHQNLLLSSNC